MISTDTSVTGFIPQLTLQKLRITKFWGSNRICYYLNNQLKPSSFFTNEHLYKARLSLHKEPSQLPPAECSPTNTGLRSQLFSNTIHARHLQQRKACTLLLICFRNILYTKCLYKHNRLLFW